MTPEIIHKCAEASAKACDAFDELMPLLKQPEYAERFVLSWIAAAVMAHYQWLQRDKVERGLE